MPESKLESKSKLKLLHICPDNYDSPYHRDGGIEKGLKTVFQVDRLNLDELRNKDKNYENRVREVVAKFSPEIIFISNNAINLKLLEELKRQAFIMFLLQDTHNGIWYHAIELGLRSNVLLVNQSQPEHFAEYHKSGVKHVRTFYQAADPGNYFPLHNNLETCPIDLIFLGKEKTYYNNPWYQIYSMYLRKKIIYDLSAMSDFRLMVIGKNWNRALLNYYIAEAFKLEANHYISNSKMTLGIQGNPHIAGAMSIRYFNHLLTGRLHLALYSKGAEKYFQDGVHLRYYRTIDELIELIHYYLKHLDEADKIGMAGRAEILKNHTYECRARQLLSIYKEVTAIERKSKKMVKKKSDRAIRIKQVSF